jgi:hypothetical protein
LGQVALFPWRVPGTKKFHPQTHFSEMRAIAASSISGISLD